MPLSDAEKDSAFSLFQELLRFDTTNPPGNEAEAAERTAEFLTEGGVDCQVLESTPGRKNVVARVKGTGEEEPILLAGHLDVVNAKDGEWKHDPFGGEVVDGWIWGRGAIDCKNMVAMSAALAVHLVQNDVKLKRDVIIAAVADEEAGCDMGSMWLVDHHPELVRAEYALGEVGGFPVHMMGKTFYPVQVAEKGIAWLKATATGESGHGSLPRNDSGLVRIAQAVAYIAMNRLPHRVVPTMETYIKTIAAHLPPPAKWVFPQLLSPTFAELVLDKVLPDKDVARAIGAGLSNTASPTVLHAGEKTNVHPASATVELDGRTLPGQTAADLIRELTELCGMEDLSFEVIREAPPVVTPKDTPLFEAITAALKRADPDGIPVPYLLPGFTDAKAFHKLGTKWYGLNPVRWEAESGVRFADLYHQPNERIPVEGFRWGCDVLADVVKTFSA